MVNTVDKQRFRHVGLVAKRQEASIADALRRIAKKLAAHNCTVTYDNATDTVSVDADGQATIPLDKPSCKK